MDYEEIHPVKIDPNGDGVNDGAEVKQVRLIWTDVEYGFIDFKRTG